MPSKGFWKDFVTSFAAFLFFSFRVGVGGVMYIQTRRRQNTLTIMEKWTDRQTQRYTAWRRAERILCIQHMICWGQGHDFFKIFHKYVYVYVYVYMHVWIYVCMCLCVCMCIYVYAYVYVYLNLKLYVRDPRVCVVSSFCLIPSFRRCGSKFSISCTYVRANNFP